MKLNNCVGVYNPEGLDKSLEPQIVVPVFKDDDKFYIYYYESYNLQILLDILDNRNINRNELFDELKRVMNGDYSLFNPRIKYYKENISLNTIKNVLNCELSDFSFIDCHIVYEDDNSIIQDSGVLGLLIGDICYVGHIDYLLKMADEHIDDCSTKYSIKEAICNNFCFFARIKALKYEYSLKYNNEPTDYSKLNKLNYLGLTIKELNLCDDKINGIMGVSSSFTLNNRKFSKPCLMNVVYYGNNDFYMDRELADRKIIIFNLRHNCNLLESKDILINYAKNMRINDKPLTSCGFTIPEEKGFYHLIELENRSLLHLQKDLDFTKKVYSIMLEDENTYIGDAVFILSSLESKLLSSNRVDYYCLLLDFYFSARLYDKAFDLLDKLKEKDNSKKDLREFYLEMFNYSLFLDNIITQIDYENINMNEIKKMLKKGSKK